MFLFLVRATPQSGRWGEVPPFSWLSPSLAISKKKCSRYTRKGKGKEGQKELKEKKEKRDKKAEKEENSVFLSDPLGRTICCIECRNPSKQQEFKAHHSHYPFIFR